jgi:bifunctional enzyme CysN/CysC/sulfate adenylyltransferase subunit 1
MPDGTSTLRVAFTGEVDHGKSTLIGRLLLDTGGVTGDRLSAGIEDGGLAFLLDGLAEERAELFTLDTVQAVVETAGRRIVFIDVPGHVELLRNMVTGSARADVGVVVVDVTAGVTPQTYRHVRILRLLGVVRIVCAVTKMDVVDHAERPFVAAALDVTRLAVDVNADLAGIVPVSAIGGCNVTTDAGDRMPWYSGTNLLQTLLALDTGRNRTERLRFSVQTVLGSGEDPLIAGRVESGTLRLGNELVDAGSGGRLRVTGIERYGDEPLHAARAGDSVALRVTGDRPRPGSVITPPEDPMDVADRWTVRLLGIAREPVAVGTVCTVNRTGPTVSARLETMHGTDALAFGEIVGARLRLAAPTTADVVDRCPETARFMLCDRAGEAVALGVIECIADAPDGAVTAAAAGVRS